MNQVIAPSSHERNGNKGVVAPKDPLGPFRKELKRQVDRYKPVKLTTYIEGVYDGVYPIPPRNSSELIVKALAATSPRRHPAGYFEYPVFTNRGDEWAIYGIPRSIDDYMRYLRAESRLNTRDRMMVVMAPTGAGKSTLNQVPIIELERFTDLADPAPVYGIKDCPINEEPLHILDEETRAIWKREKGIVIEGKLCPHCQDKAEIGLARPEMSDVFNAAGGLNRLPFEVQALRFSLALGRGITRLEPRTTNFIESNAGTLIPKAILGSNRGILYIPELGQHSPEFLRTLNDLIRGRKYSVNGQVFELDNVIIADMTLAEWEGKWKGSAVANQSLIERVEKVVATYPLDPISELAVLRKRITSSSLDTPPHFSPRTLEDAALWAARTRLVEYDKTEGGKVLKLDQGEKAKLYSGKDVAGFSQSDRRAVEEKGREAGEGTKGVSPPALWEIVSKMIGEQITTGEELGRVGCVDMVELNKRVGDFIISNSILSHDEQTKIAKQMDFVMEDYNEWLLKTVEEAFQDRYPERANALLNQYLDEAEYMLKGDKKIDLRTKDETEPDVLLVTGFEDAVAGEALGGEKNEKRVVLRMELYNWAGKVKREQKRDVEYADYYDKFPHFKKAVQKTLGVGLDDPQEILKNAQTPTTKQAEKLVEMEGRLIGEYGFCECCAPKLIRYVSSQLK